MLHFLINAPGRDMQHFIKKVGIFLMIVSIGLMLALPEVQAQQTTSPEDKAAPAKSKTIEDLKTIRAVIEKMKDIDAALKAKSLEYLDEALADLNQAAGFNYKTQELLQFIKAAAGRLNMLRTELKKPIAAVETIEKQARRMDTSLLERRFRQEKFGLAKEKGKLQEWDDRLSAEKTTIDHASEKMVIAASRLHEIQTELETLADVAEDDIGNYSRMLSLRSEREKLRAENKLNELRQQSHNLLVELFGMERDVSRKAVESRSARLAVWQAEVQKRRQQEAARARQEAREAMDQMRILPKMIKEQFDINIQLSTELEGLIREEADLAEQYEKYQSRLKALETDFATAKRRFELTELSEAMGLALRKKRFNLSASDLYVVDSSDHDSRMSAISEKQIVLDEMLDEMASPEALVQDLVGSVSFLSDDERKSFDLKIQELIANRIEILEKLKSGYNRIIKLSHDIVSTNRTIAGTADKFRELLDRHLLWTRSSKRLSSKAFLNLKHAFMWAFGPGTWYQISQDLSRSWRQNRVIWSLGFIMVLALVLAVPRARRKLKDIHTRVQQQPLQDSIALTIQALGLTVLLALVWPFIMAFPSVVVLKLRQIGLHTRAIASGLLVAAQILFVFKLLYNISRKNGLAQVHFRWANSARQTLRHNLGWFIPIVVVCHFMVAAMNSISDIESADVLANFALIVLSIAVVIFLVRLMRFKGSLTSVLIQKHPRSWLTRLRYVWFPLLIGLPLLMLYLTVGGYYYSALEINRLMSLTIILVFGLIILNDLVLRYLMLTRRQFALKKARMARQLQQEQEKQTVTDPDSAPAAIDAAQTSPLESTIGMEALDEQTRILLMTVIFFLGLLGLWAILEPVFPAFGILQTVKLWSYTAVVDGVSQLRTITLTDVAVTTMIITITVIAVRNLPGLLEMILLNRMPDDPGARYAYVAICRYTLTAVGIVITLNTLGIRWSSLQWLVAALGVGIGFGLQEIVANFICGLIILFERPVRVGDIVTIGETDGVVTKIRIRATTIRGWDLKELLVPNKEFITGRLLNWSLSDPTTRVLIVVGVAYGSDVEKAMALMEEAAEEHERVLADPEPTTSFDVFGDNALTLTLRAYLSSTDYRIATTTDLNKAINHKFAEAGIEISFPQRDVHLDAKGPLEVRMVPEQSGSKDA
jgi:potassium efflux system protein